jgi:hypothetical protein
LSGSLSGRLNLRGILFVEELFDNTGLGGFLDVIGSLVEDLFTGVMPLIAY